MPDKPDKQRVNRWGPLQPLGEAVRFLTVFPVPGLPPMDEAAAARSMMAFPLAGLLIGVFGAGTGLLAGWLFGEPLRAVAVVVAWMVVTWGLHLDGLADSADALFSRGSRERKLEIMKDSRIGTMGSLALISAVVLKVGALYSLGPLWWIGALIAPMWGRWAGVYGVFWFATARETGMGRSFRDSVRRRDFWVATAGMLLVGGILLTPWGALAGLAVWGSAHVLARKVAAALGGLTGDTYGALSETGEVVALLTLAALYHRGVL